MGIGAAAAHGNGLANLRTRAQRLGGDASIGFGPGGRGTVLTWRVPVTQRRG